MAYNDLREWITALDRAGELKRIKAESDPILEIAEITDRVSKWGSRGGQGPGGPALLFENLKGYPGSKLLINQFGSERRMNLALNSDSLDEIAGRIRQFMDVKSPQGFLDKVKMLPMLAEMGSFFPKVVSSGPCKEVIRRGDFSLLRFPGAAMLAGGRRTLHHSAVRHLARPAQRQAQRRHVSHAGLRRDLDRHALAAPEKRRRALSRPPAAPQPPPSSAAMRARLPSTSWPAPAAARASPRANR